MAVISFFFSFYVSQIILYKYNKGRFQKKKNPTPASQVERWINNIQKIHFFLYLYYLYNRQIWREL